MNDVITWPLSEHLIQRLAGMLETEYISKGKDLSRLAFVFGGKRPGMFLKKELARRIKGPYFSPRFFAIDEFVDCVLAQSGDYARINDLEACYLMYRLVKKETPGILRKRQSFAEFLPWSREILKFIEQLDLEDIDEEKIRSIQLNAEIGYDVPADINQLLSNILDLRTAYHARLKKDKTISRGLAYLLASRIERPGLDQFDTVFFCNFFYLTRTEEALIEHVRQSGKAVLIFQGGREWPVLDKLAKRSGWPIERFDPAGPDFQLSIHAGFDLHSQVCLVRDLVKTLSAKEQNVIVLPDARSLIPLVSEVSSHVSEFNVSLGYPLKRSPLYSLFECVSRAQQTRRDGQYYAKDYLRAISHPLVKNLRLANNDPAVTRILVHKVEEIITGLEETELGGSLFVGLERIEGMRQVYDLALTKTKHMEVQVSFDDLKLVLKELHRYLFHHWEKVTTFAGFSDSLEDLLQVLLEKSFLSQYPLNIKIIERLMDIRDEFSQASFSDEPFSREELFKVFHNKLENDMVNFSGSPLKGLQILGLLETRSLNFKNVVVMDTNEGSLPSLKITQPLIPREIMVRLGLDQLEQEEEIQRYQFRRLISSANKVHLVYEEGSRNERSRFIEELLWEREKAQGKLDVLDIAQAEFRVDMHVRQVAIRKKPEEIEFLRNLTYSASSVNTYLQCPLQFYYQYCLGLKEKDDLLDEPEAADIGTFIHNLLEDSYKGFLGRKPVIDKRFEKDFFELLDERFSQKLEKRMKSDSFLLKEIIDVRMKDFLANERRRPVLQVLGLEQKFTGTLELGGQPFNFQARVDRIDRLNDGTVLVIDYKTGDISHNIPRNGINFDGVQFSREWIRDNIRSFQLPLYLYFLDRRFKGERTNASLYDIREPDTRDFGLTSLLKTEADFADKDRLMIEYMNALEFVLKEIIDPAVDFVPDSCNEHVCKYCPFGALCK